MASYPALPPSPPASASSKPFTGGYFSPTIPHRNPSGRTPSPVYRISSPYRVPSPYNASRPRPRKGFVDRVKNKFRAFLRALREYARENPIKTGLLALVPVVAGGALVSMALTAGKGLIDYVMDDGGKKAKSKDDKKDEDQGIFKDFVCFGGCKPEWGSRDGILKMFHMFINHWCRLSSSSFPRFLAVLMDLYFLEALKRK